MSIKGMHYDVKVKLNKVDSQQYRNLLIPEIDWALNEAVGIFIKRIAQPRKIQQAFDFGFEKNLVSSKATITKNNCNDVKAGCVLRQHDDNFEASPFDKSSFEWREVNIRFYNDGIKVFSDGTFVINSLQMDYIRKPAYIHNAEDFGSSNQYILPDGTLLTGFQNCELPSQTHSEIVDIAVLVLTGELQYSDYNIKREKLNLIN